MGLNPTLSTHIDRARAEDLILTQPKLHTHEKKKKRGVTKFSGDTESEIHSDLTTTKDIFIKEVKHILVVIYHFSM